MMINLVSQVTLAMEHCSLCGATDPAAGEGYTKCCNEPLCDGLSPGGMVPAAIAWEYRGRDSDGQDPTTILACCEGVAERHLGRGWQKTGRWLDGRSTLVDDQTGQRTYVRVAPPWMLEPQTGS